MGTILFDILVLLIMRNLFIKHYVVLFYYFVLILQVSKGAIGPSHGLVFVLDDFKRYSLRRFATKNKNPLKSNLQFLPFHCAIYNFIYYKFPSDA